MDQLIQIAGGQTPQDNPVGNLAKLVKQMKNITGYLHHLESGVVAMSHELQAQGLGLQMLMRILIEKGHCTEEEIKKYHNTYVFEPMQKMAKEMQDKMAEAEKVAKAKGTQEVLTAEETPEMPPTLDETNEDEHSDVVLASERANNVVRFPSDRQDS